jgi:hypothetical protein
VFRLLTLDTPDSELAGEKLGWHCLAANADRARVFESAAGYMPF